MRSPRLPFFTVHPVRRRGTAAVFLTAALLAGNVSAIGAAEPPSGPAADPAVITAWNATAVATIVTDAGKANAEAFLWYGFEQAAVYNAVVGITRRFELYRWNTFGPKDASPEAAAAAAAHRVLLTYFPASQGRLDADLATSLEQIPDGPAKEKGVLYGQLAADRIIELRTDDGRFADITFTVPLGPGVWRPTPPGFAPFFDPWLSQVRPLLLTSPSQFRPASPPALTSETYEEEFEEVRDYGVATDSLRTPLQTETALFFSDIGVGPLQAALRDLVTRRHMDISDSARLFGAVDMSIADAVGAVWDSKFHFGFWRPVTAIQLADDDGNPETDGVDDWLPLVVTPPYPDYASGLTGVIGALTRTLSRLLGDGRVDLNITSVAAGLPGQPLTRHYEFAADLNRDVVDARVWSGIHFRTADVVGIQIGTQVGNWALNHYFQRDDDDDEGIDAVVAWNANAGEASVAACFLGGYAPQEARMYAMMHVAIHDALNGIDRRSHPYAADLLADPDTSPDAAVAAAARDVLVAVLGSFSFFLPADCINAGVASVEADYVAALDAIEDDTAKAQGIALGQDAAEAILALRASDGYDTPPIDPDYQEGTAPGEYRYTPGTPFAFAPGLGEDLTPFALNDGSQFRPGPPYRLTSGKYAADVNEVQRLGGDDVTTPSARTDEQTEIALFWVESSPLQWNRITRTVSTAEELDLWENARLFGLLNIALTDGYIGTFETKYHYRFWRPVTAIRLADIDDNPATTADPTWTPLLQNPPIPDYDSGHAVEGGVAAQVLSRFFHSDSMSFSLCSFTLPDGETCADETPTLRHFTRFSQAMHENALSRIYVGFHFRDAVETGIRHGEKIGNWTVNRVMRPVRSHPLFACRVKNKTQDTWLASDTGSALTSAITAANPGDQLNVFGRCVGTYVIDKDLSFSGSSRLSSPTILDAAGQGRVLVVGPGATVMIDRLIITGGSSTTGGGGGINLSEGGTLTLNRSIVAGNTTTGGGGGIVSGGSLTLNDSLVARNHAGFDGGGIFNFGDVTMNDSSLIGNIADGAGGGLFNEGTATLNDSRVRFNTASSAGGVLNVSLITINSSDISSNDPDDCVGC